MQSKWMKFKLDGKKIRKDQILILFLAGVLLLVIALPTKSGKNDSQNNGLLEKDVESGSTDDDYVSVMEAHLEDTISQMEGAGEVSVMLTLKSTQEKVIEKDTESSDETVEETDSQGGERTTKNKSYREEAVYNSEGSSGSEPYVRKELSPEVEGVVVIAEGGDNAVVVKNITEAIQALFGIDTHKIRIVKGRRADQ